MAIFPAHHPTRAATASCLLSAVFLAWVKLFRPATPTKCVHWIPFMASKSPTILKHHNSIFMKYQSHETFQKLHMAALWVWNGYAIIKNFWRCGCRHLLDDGPAQAALQPDLVTYGTALAVLDQAQQWQRALELLAELPRRRIQASCAAINSAMACCEPCFKMPVEVWWRMVLKHVERRLRDNQAGLRTARAHPTPSKLNRRSSHKNDRLWWYRW